jgi:hypothetical protein
MSTIFLLRSKIIAGISVTGVFRFHSGDLQALGGDNRGAAGQLRANPA